MGCTAAGKGVMVWWTGAAPSTQMALPGALPCNGSTGLDNPSHPSHRTAHPPARRPSIKPQPFSPYAQRQICGSFPEWLYAQLHVQPPYTPCQAFSQGDEQ